MAGTMVAIREEGSVNEWKGEAIALNDRANTIINQSMEILRTFSEMAEGNIFTHMVSLANQVLEGMKNVMRSLTELLNAVTELVNQVKNIVGNLVDGVIDVVSHSIQ